MNRRSFLKSAGIAGATVTFYSYPALGADPSGIEKIRFLNSRITGRELFPRPLDGQNVMQNPPGFTWLPAPGASDYRVVIKRKGHGIVYRKSVGTDPVHLPDITLEPGTYSWNIEALDNSGNCLHRRGYREFTIAQEAAELPWMDPQSIIDRIPQHHPRFFYDQEKTEEIRRTLHASRIRQWEACKAAADKELDRLPPEKPRYHLTGDATIRKMEYKHYFHYFRQHVDGAMMNLTIAYVATGKLKYAEAARRILLEIATWDTSDDDVTSVSAEWGDEPGLSYARYGYKAYDWLYPVLDTNERELVRRMVEDRAGQVYRHLKHRSNFLTYPSSSHDGRLISYLAGMALVLGKESPHSATWLEYSMKALTTLYPHWGGYDGGWAEGIPYGLWYNQFYIPEFEALEKLAGINLWSRPFFNKIRYFFFYGLSPKSEIRPFGDSAVSFDPASYKPTDFCSLLKWHAHKFNDPYIGWWIQQTEGWNNAITGEKALYYPDDDPVESPGELPSAKAFNGVGWAALHGNLEHPEKDAFLLFKSSPYGSVSHSHADQNAFTIQRGHAALAIPSGYYGPAYGLPHHAEWTRSTKANNGILVNGEGQVVRDAKASGRIIGFQTSKRLSYVAGDATAAYRGRLERWHRHILMLNPGIFLVLDDLASSKPATFQWLLHALEKMEVDANKVVSRRKGAALTVHLYAPGGLVFSQTDQFDTPYNEGIPEQFRGSTGGKIATREPPNHWHMTASTLREQSSIRIGAIMVVTGPGEEIDLDIREESEQIRFVATGSFGSCSGGIQIMDKAQAPLLWGKATDGEEFSV